MKTFTPEVNDRGRRHLSSRRFRRIPRSGITRAELDRLITEMGGDEVRQVMRALNLPMESLDTPAE